MLGKMFYFLSLFAKRAFGKIMFQEVFLHICITNFDSLEVAEKLLYYFISAYFEFYYLNEGFSQGVLI